MKIETGFTLLELMAAIAVGGILLAVAIPSYQNMTKNNCMTTNATNLVSSFQLARSEAIKRRQNVLLSANNAAGANEWGDGWTVWQDANSNSTLNAGEEIRIVQLSCALTTIDETGDDTAFTYLPTGFIDAAGTFNICDDRTGERGRQITLSTTGRPSTNSNFTCP